MWKMDRSTVLFLVTDRLFLVLILSLLSIIVFHNDLSAQNRIDNEGMTVLIEGVESLVNGKWVPSNYYTTRYSQRLKLTVQNNNCTTRRRNIRCNSKYSGASIGQVNMAFELTNWKGSKPWSRVFFLDDEVLIAGEKQTVVSEIPNSPNLSGTIRRAFRKSPLRFQLLYSIYFPDGRPKVLVKVPYKVLVPLTK
ncbi:MAG: hypothetical protein HKN76_16400 [Saprospiraceae bacterium]|nr:hypothetical protein [Saprospiraceae bacterium]